LSFHDRGGSTNRTEGRDGIKKRVIPAKAGIHPAASRCSTMDPGFRRDDGCRGFAGMTDEGAFAGMMDAGIVASAAVR
jgi:hypothetical protein